MEAVLRLLFPTQQRWFLQLSTLEKVCLKLSKFFSSAKSKKLNRFCWSDWFFWNWVSKCFSMTYVNHYDSNHIYLKCMILIFRFEVINKIWITEILWTRLVVSQTRTSVYMIVCIDFRRRCWRVSLAVLFIILPSCWTCCCWSRVSIRERDHTHTQNSQDVA